MSLNIKIVKDDSKFKNFLPIFGTKEFLETKSDNFGWFISDNFILPFYIDKRAIFSKLVFTTETIILESGDENRFLEELIIKSKELDIDLIAQPLASVLFKIYPQNSKYIEWGSYVVDLMQSEEDILKNMHSKHRNVIRKGIKSEHLTIYMNYIRDFLDDRFNVKLLEKMEKTYAFLSYIKKILDEKTHSVLTKLNKCKKSDEKEKILKKYFKKDELIMKLIK